MGSNYDGRILRIEIRSTRRIYKVNRERGVDGQLSTRTTRSRTKYKMNTKFVVRFQRMVSFLLLNAAEERAKIKDKMILFPWIIYR